MRSTVSAATPGVVCGQCGRLNSLARHQCEYCGKRHADEKFTLVTVPNGCPACGVLAPRGARRCISCGGPTEAMLAQRRGVAPTSVMVKTRHSPVTDMASSAPASVTLSEGWRGALFLVSIVVIAVLILLAGTLLVGR
jgi:uncharacterized OB-fold protein